MSIFKRISEKLESGLEQLDATPAVEADPTKIETAKKLGLEALRDSDVIFLNSRESHVLQMDAIEKQDTGEIPTINQ